MSWYDTKQAAVDPDNPASNEQVPFSEYNALVAYLKDKINNKTVDLTGITNDMIMVYDLANDKFVFETPSAVGSLDDLTDVVISGTPADNEVLAYDTGSSEFINQTAAEAGLATVAGMASYLALAGGTMAGNLNMGDYQINGVDDIQAYDIGGVAIRDNAGTLMARIGNPPDAFTAYANINMYSHKIFALVDPTDAQEASTKNYSDTHLFTKEAVTTFTDGYIPVYRTASGKFEMEAQSSAGAVLESDFNATTFMYALADNTPLPKTPAEVMAILSGANGAEFLFGTQKIGGIVDPTTAQQASTKNYADMHLFTKEAVTSFSNGYIPVYRTASGKFEMEEQSAALGLPVVDTTAIVKGSGDGTKKVRFEVDYITTGTTRVLTVQDKDMTIADTAEVMLLNGIQAMAGDLDMGGNDITNCNQVFGTGDAGYLLLLPAQYGATISLCGKDKTGTPGKLSLMVPDAAKHALVQALTIPGVTDTPLVAIGYGLDMNDTILYDPKNSAASALSGTQKDIEIDIGGTAYYFTVYPTKA